MELVASAGNFIGVGKVLVVTESKASSFGVDVVDRVVALLVLLADTGGAVGVGVLVAVVSEFVASVVMGCPRFTSKAQITVTAHTTDPPIRAATVNMHAFDLFSKRFMLLAPHNGESALLVWLSEALSRH